MIFHRLRLLDIAALGVHSGFVGLINLFSLSQRP